MLAGGCAAGRPAASYPRQQDWAGTSKQDLNGRGTSTGASFGRPGHEWATATSSPTVPRAMACREGALQNTASAHSWLYTLYNGVNACA